MTIAAVIDPAVAVTMTMHDDVRAADDTADDTAGNCADGPGNDGTRASTDGDAFERTSLGRDGHCRQHRNQHSSLEDRAHEKLLG
jgi:hypothetical protein